jgi:hypothetical protein
MHLLERVCIRTVIKVVLHEHHIRCRWRKADSSTAVAASSCLANLNNTLELLSFYRNGSRPRQMQAQYVLPNTLCLDFCWVP